MQFDLTTEAGRKALANTIHADVEEATSAHFAEPKRRHLGASIIGHECARYLFANFRWALTEKVAGRMRRLWNRGHLEEPRMIAWLRMIGFIVHEYDHDGDGLTQYRIEGAHGHFGGSLDSIAFAPERYGLNGIPLLPEYKTHADKYFKAVKKNGVIKEQPKHFKQMCSYGRAYGIKYGLYCAVNKNDDDLYYEIVELDWQQADDLFRKADYIIFSKEPPPRISDTPTFYKCKMCPQVGICHLDEPIDKNCRSCRHASPGPAKSWDCALHGPDIPKDFIPQGCGDWSSIL
jgi:hypothetical protein